MPADEVLADYVADVLTEERARKASLEARGAALVTASGAFATLVLAIATFGGDQVHLPGTARWSLVAAVTCFLLSAGCGAWLNKPANYDEPSADSLRETIDKGWDRETEAVRKTVAYNIVAVLAAARTVNEHKACWLLRGSALHVLAIVGVTAAAAIVIATTAT